MVNTTWTADVTWYEFAFDADFEDDVWDEIEWMIINDEIGTSDEEMYEAMVWLITNNLEYYAFTTGNVTTEYVSAGVVGSGFIVTPDGYMVTNAHVVETDEDEMYMAFAWSALEDTATEATNAFMADMRRLGYQMSDYEWEMMANAWLSLFAQTMDVNNLRTSYQAFIGNVTPGSDVSAKGKRAEIRRIGASIPGKDIAILKMDATNLPTVTLGDDTDIRTGDQVYAMGYPASATLSDALNIMQAIQEPTLTQGIISARKEMMNGWTIFQTDVDIHGGNSGGPLFNSAGEVIGVNTFGMIDEAGSVAGMNFAIPISVAKEFLNEINVTPTESKFTSDFKRAHAMVESGDYLGAVELLRSINDVNPGFPVVQELLASARQLADANPTTAEKREEETDETQALVPEKGKDEKKILGLGPTTFYIVLAAVVVIIVLALVLILTRKKRRAAKSAYPQGQPPQHYPPQQAHQAPPMQQPIHQPMQQPMQQAPPMQQPMHQAPTMQQPMHQAPPVQQQMPPQVQQQQYTAPLPPVQPPQQEYQQPQQEHYQPQAEQVSEPIDRPDHYPENE